MSWQERSELGTSLIAEICEAMKVPDQWRVDHPRGFTWWADDFAQHVWCDPGLYHNAQAVYRVHAETDLLRGRGQAEKFEFELEKAMDASTFSAVIYDQAQDTYKLHCSVYAHSENIHWLRRSLFAAVAIQVAEAHIIGHELARKLHAVPASSAHPQNGIRGDKDPMLSVIDMYFKPNGAQPSKWEGAPEWEEMEEIMERQALSYDSDHKTHMRAAFEWKGGFGADRTQLEVTTTEPHPTLGNGLHLTLTLPIEMTPEHLAHLALELNQLERNEWKRSHMLGSWCVHQESLAFRSFVPNTVYNKDLLEQFTLNMGLRADWVSDYFEQRPHRMAAVQVQSPESHLAPSPPVSGF